MTRTQTDHLLRHLQRGHSVSPLLALNRWGIFRLAARVYGLRQAGVSVRTEMVRRNGKHYARYFYP